MIYFNDTALESVAPVKIEDVRVSPIQINVTARQRSIIGGADFVRVRDGSRTATITFALLTNDRAARQRQLREITNWARTSTPGKLQLPYFNGYLECLCTSLPEPSLRQWWESRLSITFTTYGNPYWNSIIERSAECGTQFSVLGDAPPLMRIIAQIETADTDLTFSDGTNSMTFEGLPAGEMALDLNRQTAAIGSASAMPYYTYNSAFIVPKTGTQTISGTGTVFWRERWE